MTITTTPFLAYHAHTPVFLETWFTNVDSVGSDARIVQEAKVAFINPETPRLTIMLPAAEWMSELEDDGSTLELNLRTLVDAMEGKIYVYPWNIIRSRFDDLFGSLNQKSADDAEKTMPGFYVDFYGGDNSSPYIDKINRFFDELTHKYLVGPTLLTYEHTGERRWRMWWKIIDLYSAGVSRGHTTPQLPGTPTHHLSWGKYIQSLARRSGLTDSLHLNPRFDLSGMLYPLPGVGSEIVRRGEPLSWSNASLMMDAQIQESNAMWAEYFSGGAWRTMSRETLDSIPWDDILRPVGWQSLGVDADGWNYWGAPGRVAVGITKGGGELRLWGQHQLGLCGLKEVSDAGIALDKRVVACLLGWDGDRKAFLKHWKRTGTLYE